MSMQLDQEIEDAGRGDPNGVSISRHDFKMNIADGTTVNCSYQVYFPCTRILELAFPCPSAPTRTSAKLCIAQSNCRVEGGNSRRLSM